MTNLWSGRFSTEPDKAVFEFGRSLAVDKRLIEEDLTGSQAWAEALQRAGVLTTDDARAIVDGLEAIRRSVRDQPSLLDTADDEDVHAFVERHLIERIGDTGRRLHTGRSRNEQVSVDFRLYLRRWIPDLQGGIADLVDALVAQAGRAGDAVMPSYTHLRRAQPVLVAHMWLSHAAALRRDVSRLDAARDEANWMPLGSGAIAGTSYAIDPAWLAARLGFDRVVPNSIDTAGDRDFAAAFLFACALAMTHLSRLAEDVILFTSEEFGFFELADEVATGSSLMPQKKNPDPMELVRGKVGTGHRRADWMAGRVEGHRRSGTTRTSRKTKPRSSMPATRSRRAWRCQPRSSDRSRRASRRCIGRRPGLLLATEVADYLVGRGVPFRTAHEITGRIVRDLYERGRDFSALSLEDWRRYDDRFDEDIAGAITPEAAVRARRTPQSTNPGEVSRALADTRAWVETSRRAGR